MRGGILAVIVLLFAATGLRLFATPSSAAGASRAALRDARHARLTTPGGSRTAGQRRSPATSRTVTPSPAPSVTAPAQVSGASVTAVGDSVMVASTPALDQALPGIHIDAQVGRQFSTGLQVIADLKAQGKLRQIVVVGLGTNGTVTSGEISQLYSEIGPGRRLVLVNTYEARPWEQEVNNTLAAAAAAHPATTVLADWHAAIENRTNLLWPDGIHPQPSGGIVYAAMLKAALQRLMSLPG